MRVITDAVAPSKTDISLPRNVLNGIRVDSRFEFWGQPKFHRYEVSAGVQEPADLDGWSFCQVFDIVAINPEWPVVPGIDYASRLGDFLKAGLSLFNAPENERW